MRDQLLQDLDVVRVILEKAETDLVLKRGRPARRLRTAAATLAGMADAWDNANRGGSVESDGPPTHAGTDDPAPPPPDPRDALEPRSFLDHDGWGQ